MEEVCRVCMETSVALTNIFVKTQKWDTCIADMILECTGYVVRRGDSLPEYICSPCLEDAVSAFKLKKTCEQSHQLHFTLMEKEGEEDICDNLEDEQWKESDSESEWSNHFETDEKINQNDTVKTDHLERPYKCPDCPKSYKYSISSNISILTLESDRISVRCALSPRTLSGERNFTCSHCEKSFTRSGTLRNHLRMHAGARPYHCSQCSTTYNQLTHLKNHILRAHTAL